MKLRTVNSTVDLQELITHTILTQQGYFCSSQIIDEIMTSKFFNDFCDRKELCKFVNEKIKIFMECGYIDKTPKNAYFVL